MQAKDRIWPVSEGTVQTNPPTGGIDPKPPLCLPRSNGMDPSPLYGIECQTGVV